ncbi:MAG: hypothetical protein PHW60_00715 [Kiritimatiellae bacterium]|nr:hypothetical protein [Kiritimatiellia bacterium]
MRISLIIPISVAACALHALAASDRAAEFRFYKDLQLRGTGPQEDILITPLDSEVYNGTQAGCPDIRIFDKHLLEMPYVLEKSAETQMQSIRRESAGKTTSLRELPDNRIEVTWDLVDKEPPVTSFTIESPLKNFEKHASVFGVAPDGKEVELVHEAMICDYSRYMDVRHMEVALVENSFRRYRIRIDDIVDKQSSPLTELEHTYRQGDLAEQKDRTTVERRTLRIESIRGWHTVAEERIVKDHKASYAPLSFNTEQKPKDRLTVVTIRMRREPLTALAIETPDRNFSRSVTLEATVMNGVRKTWRILATAQISFVQFRSFHDEKLKIEFPEQRAEEYRLTIRNADNAPLHITGIRAEGNVYRLCWLTRPDLGMRVYYGSEAAGAPSYDTATVLASLGKGVQGVEGKLLPQQANPVFRSSTLGSRRILESKGLFIAAVCLVVALLGWGLFRAGRKIETTKEE